MSSLFLFNSSATLNEYSLTNARHFLSGVFEAAYNEPYNMILAAEGFEDGNRGIWHLVVAYIAR